MLKLSWLICIFAILTVVACNNGFCFDDGGEICLTKRNSTAASCGLKPYIQQIKEILLKVKSEMVELKEKISKVEATCQQVSGTDCLEIKKKGGKTDGVYSIDPDGKGSFNAYCDMTTDGGGWTVFQNRRDGSVDFFRGWNDYKKGFGDVNGEFWLGLDNIHRLTQSKKNELRIDLEDSGAKKFAKHSSFAIANEGQKYKLTLGAYSGNAGDSFSRNNGMAFTTKDSDNDTWQGKNCAVSFKGGWWYDSCHRANLNGIYYHGRHSSFADGINWYTWRGYHYSLSTASMKLRPI